MLSAGLGAMLIPLVLVMLQLQAVVPRSVLVLYPLVLIFLMAGSRFAYRIWKEHRLYSPLAALGEPVLVVGAGEAGARLTDGARRAAGNGASSACSTTIRRSRAGRCATSACSGPIAELAVWAAPLRRAQGDHRAAVDAITRCAGASPSCARRRASKR